MRIPNRRRKLILDRMQFRLLGFGFLYMGFGLAVLTTFLFAPAVVTLFSPSATLQQREAAAGEFLALHGRLWPAAALVMLLFTIHGLFVSHRIAGPLYRFRQVFRAVGKGDFSARVVLRRHDYLHGDAQVLNEMLAGLRDLSERIQSRMVELEQAVLALEEKWTCDGEGNPALDDVRKKLADLQTRTGVFLVDNSSVPQSKTPQPVNTPG